MSPIWPPREAGGEVDIPVYIAGLDTTLQTWTRSTCIALTSSRNGFNPLNKWLGTCGGQSASRAASGNLGDLMASARQAGGRFRQADRRRGPAEKPWCWRRRGLVHAKAAQLILMRGYCCQNGSERHAVMLVGNNPDKLTDDVVVALSHCWRLLLGLRVPRRKTPKTKNMCRTKRLSDPKPSPRAQFLLFPWHLLRKTELPRSRMLVSKSLKVWATLESNWGFGHWEPLDGDAHNQACFPVEQLCPGHPLLSPRPKAELQLL